MRLNEYYTTLELKDLYFVHCLALETQAYLVLLHLRGVFFVGGVFTQTEGKTPTSKKITRTYFIAILTLLQWSGMELNISEVCLYICCLKFRFHFIMKISITS